LPELFNDGITGLLDRGDQLLFKGHGLPRG
jgi:hypothetical protein